MKIGQVINPPTIKKVQPNIILIPEMMGETHTPMISNIGGTLKIIGQPSYTEYIFTDENRVQMVKNEDVPDLLSKERKAKPCCNGENTDLHIFSIYK